MIKFLSCFQVKDNTKKNICQYTVRIFAVCFIFLIAGYLLLFVGVNSTHASRVDEIKRQMELQNSQIAELEKEIVAYEIEIDKTLEVEGILKNEINQSNITSKKLNSSISLTEKKIEMAEYNIEKLSLEINDKENQIGNKRGSLGEIIRNVDEAESQTLVEILLANKTFSDFFIDLEQMDNFQKEINLNLAELRNLKTERETEKTEEAIQKKALEELKSQLVDEKYLNDVNKNRQNTLLVQTKSKESTYQKMLAKKKKQKDAFEEELLDLESQLKIAIDPTSLPIAGSGVLMWPLADASQYSCWGDSKATKNCITQYFGNTKFATQNPQIYGWSGHNGIDFRAPSGTKLYAPRGGVVRSIGNTDKVCKGVSYGEWVLIDHENGLTTLYAHLSLTKVVRGQKVETGQLIGYTGNSGYSTGPHLHFSVLATVGVQVTGENGYEKYYSKVCGTELNFPVGAKNSYFNPLSYL